MKFKKALVFNVTVTHNRAIEQRNGKSGMSLTLDQLIESLQKLKADGLDGTTPVGIPSKDNDGKARMIELDIEPCVMSIAKDEFEKSWTLCRKVTRGGEPVVVIAG